MFEGNITHGLEYISFREQPNFTQDIYKKKIFGFLWPLCFEYPHFKAWYNGLFVESGNLHTDREIIMCMHNVRLVGVAILKKTIAEKKICTLRVDQRYQRNGIGHELIERSLNWLEDDKPLITVRQSKAYQFQKLFEYFGFKLEQKYPMYYTFLGIEQVYNGELANSGSIIYNKIEHINLYNVLSMLIRKDEVIDTDALIRAIVYYEQQRARGFVPA